MNLPNPSTCKVEAGRLGVHGFRSYLLSSRPNGATGDPVSNKTNKQNNNKTHKMHLSLNYLKEAKKINKKSQKMLNCYKLAILQ